MTSTRLYTLTYTVVFFTALVFLSLIFGKTAHALPVELYGASGWAMIQSEFAGYDAVTCGASSTVGQIQLVEENSSTVVNTNIPLWQVQV